MDSIGFIGGGNMAEALIKGVTQAGLCKARDILVSDIRAERLAALTEQYSITAAEKNSEVATKAGILLICVKPQNITQALESIREAVKKDTLVISIAAGVKIANISNILGALPIVRVMPNTPALIGEGASALFANQKAVPMLDKALQIFEAVGKAVVLEDEDLMDAVTAISGSGPAYYFRITQALIEAAVELALPQDIAKELVLQTAKGAALLAAEADKKGETAAQLRQKVTSPGGTTEAAMQVFEQDNKFDILLRDATRAARDRSRRLSG